MESYQTLCLLLSLSALVLLDLPFATAHSCRPAQSNALLQFSNSLTVVTDMSCDPKTTRWENGRDCCLWDGVACDNVTGNIIGLDLSFSCLQGTLHSDSSLFALPHLQSLNLGFNNFLSSPILPELSAFTELRHLNISYSNFSGLVPTEISYLSKLVLLDLSFNGGLLRIENADFKVLVQNLTELRVFELDRVNMSAVSPSSFGNLSSSLTVFSAFHCDLQGELPPDIFRLPNLLDLDLRSNDVNVSFPKSNWSKSVESLTLSDTSISGKIPDSIGELKNLKTLGLSDCKLIGSIPSSLVNLTKLTGLDLSGNEFTGVLDFRVLSTLKNLQDLRLTVELNLAYNSVNYTFPELEFLALSSCNLTQFPLFLNSSKKLRYLLLSENQISGQIPRWFWGLGKDTLEVLDISSNLIGGDIPQFPWKELIIVQLSDNLFQGPLPTPPLRLRLFSASQNGFSGEIPSSFCKLSSLSFLSLANNNLSGSIPHCLGNLAELSNLLLSANKFEGTLPRSLENCASLSFLDVSHNEINDTFPKWLLEAPSLRVMDLKFNEFHGQIDPPTAPLLPSTLVSFFIANNKFEGPLPIPPPTALFYSIANNNFSGEISHLICEATELVVLDLSNNSLMGTLPECSMSFSKDLSVLKLRMNMIQGVIPGKIARDSNLRTLDFSRNRFEGTLPRSLLQCKNLEVLDLSNNRMEDTFPDWLEALPKLQVLVLRSNMFHGLVRSPRAARPFPELRIFDLSNNNLSGALPVRYIMKLTAMMNQDKGRGELQYMGGNGYQDSVMVTMKGLEILLVKILTVFTSIDLSSNHFGGELPVDIGSLKSLKGLNFSRNNLTGYIPPSTGNLTDLEWLDLSSNQFIGRIPRELADLTFLAFLNLSENRLIGPIPMGSQFNTFKSDSFAGNLGLCGFPLPKTCGNSSGETPPVTILQENDTEHGGWFEWRAMLMGYGSGTVAGISLGYIVINSRKLERLAGLFGRKGAKMRRKSRRNARRSYQR
ncbi:PDZ domain-containing protein [Psidium guajava]|nr:PDZ domain-containing protein [Psidium guajava]